MWLLQGVVYYENKILIDSWGTRELSTKIEEIIRLIHEDLKNRLNNKPMKNEEKIKQISLELMELEIKYNSITKSQD